MAADAPGSSILARLRRRLARRGDTELEQAGLRLIIGVVVCGYLLTLELGGPDAGETRTMLWIVASFLGAATLIMLAILLRPEVSPLRRVLGILTDMGATSAAMAVAGESGVPMLAIYLWVIVGNGFRYGTVYLAVAAGSALVGFAGVYLRSDYWQSHTFFALSYLFILVFIPGYMSALLNKVQLAMRRSDEANRAKSRFLAKMSHELRTPLNGVIGMSDLLLDGHLNPQQEGFARSIKTSASTLLGIIENVLDFSKIEAGRIELEQIDLDLHRLIREIAGVFRVQAERKGLRFFVQLDADVPYALRGDPLHLRQVLMNLLGNAVKFTDHGHVALRVLAIDRPAAPQQAWLRFEVADTGIGISEDDQARVFDSFQQATRSTQRLFGGTGLGTAIAKELAELMGGSIGLESRLGAGTRFWVEVPLEQRFPVPVPDPGELAGTRVLLVGTAGAAGPIRQLLSQWSLYAKHVDGAEQAFAELLRQRRQQAAAGYSAIILLADGADLVPADFCEGVRSQRQLDHTDLILVRAPGAEAASDATGLLAFAAVLETPVQPLRLFNALHAAHSAALLSQQVVSLAERYRRTGAQAPAAELEVLVAEDNETNRLVLKELLARIGHRVTAVTNGDEALDALERDGEAFDLMILDMNMPGHTGLDVFRAHRFMAPQQPIPAIILTADATPEAMQRCRDAGVDAYLTKPLDTQELLDTVARLAGTVEPPTRPVAPEPAQRAPEPMLGAGLGPAMGPGLAGAHAKPARPELRVVHGGQEVAPVLLDRRKLSSLYEIGKESDFFEQLVQGFLDDSETSIRQVERALEEEDYPQLHEALHALRGSAGEVGAVRMVEVCDQLRRLRPFDLGSPDAARLAQSLRETHGRTAAELTAYPAESQAGDA